VEDGVHQEEMVIFQRVTVILNDQHSQWWICGHLVVTVVELVVVWADLQAVVDITVEVADN
tara:strand:- start:175 stop:357 length:183 start_codon:yes stop_codon:yes gene_type:complete